MWVAELDGKVHGFASLTAWSDREAYRDAAESSVYVRESHRGRGLGRTLMQTLLEHAKGVRLHTVIARIAEGNPGSSSLHEALGFELTGTLRQVGHKFGRRLDVEVWQVVLGGTSDYDASAGSR